MWREEEYSKERRMPRPSALMSTSRGVFGQAREAVVIRHSPGLTMMPIHRVWCPLLMHPTCHTAPRAKRGSLLPIGRFNVHKVVIQVASYASE